MRRKGRVSMNKSLDVAIATCDRIILKLGGR